MRDGRGRLATRSSSCFLMASPRLLATPVMFAPGRARFVTRPVAIGSATAVKTIGHTWRLDCDRAGSASAAPMAASAINARRRSHGRIGVFPPERHSTKSRARDVEVEREVLVDRLHVAQEALQRVASVDGVGA